MISAHVLTTQTSRQSLLAQQTRLNVEMAGASVSTTSAMATTIVSTARMNRIVVKKPAVLFNSNAHPASASTLDGAVMGTTTVETCPMRGTVQPI
jgi:hypothetical protein